MNAVHWTVGTIRVDLAKSKVEGTLYESKDERLYADEMNSRF